MASSIRVAQTASQTDSQRQADQLFHRGLNYYQSNQLEEAIQAWRQALAIYQALQNSSSESIVLENLGHAFYRSNQFEAAIQTWRQALVAYQKIQDAQGEGDVLRNLAAAYLDLRDYPSAIAISQQALTLAQETENLPLEAYVQGNLAAVYLALRNYPLAIEFSQQALMLAREMDDGPLEAQALSNLGRALFKSNQFEEAIQTWRQALTLYQKIQDRQGEGSALGDLAAGYIPLRKYPSAMAFSQQALTLAQETGNGSLQVQALGSLGSAHRGLGNYLKAVKSYQRALEIAQQVDDLEQEASTLRLLGNVYESLGDYDQTIEFYRGSLEIARQMNDQSMESMALTNLGVAYASLGEYSQAVSFYQESLAIAQSMQDSKGMAYAFNNLGGVYHRLEDIDQAVNYYQQSLEIAQAIGLRKLHAEILTNLGIISEDLQDYEIAIAQHEESLTLSKSIGDPSLEWRILNNLGHTLMEANQLEEAEKRLRQATTNLSSLREGLDDALNRDLFDKQIHTYNLIQQVLVRQGQYEAALEASEQGRARAFVSLLLNRLDRQTASLGADQPLSLAQIKQVARQQKATLVEYTIVPDHKFMFQGKLRASTAEELYIWVVQPTGEVAFRKVDLSSGDLQLEDFAKFSRDVIGLRSRGGFELASIDGIGQTGRLQKFHRLLIEPIADLLPADPTKLVVFIPQDDLFNIPFAALKDADGQYLIQQHTLLTAPAIQVLDLTRKQRHRLEANEHLGAGQAATVALQKDDLLIVGNPEMPSIWVSPEEPAKPLSQLPAAEYEALAIAEFFDAQALIKAQATESALKRRMPDARVIHLATHGLLDYGRPQDSGVRDVPGAIALTPGEGEDGLLTAVEIFDLTLKAELVVLSACETGLGDVSEGGLVGLSRSLIKAGVPSVIVSLWSVPDAPTAELMIEFYRQWRLGLDKAQALRQAMLITMERHPAPRDWAAFTLIGEAE